MLVIIFTEYDNAKCNKSKSKNLYITVLNVFSATCMLRDEMISKVTSIPMLSHKISARRFSRRVGKNRFIMTFRVTKWFQRKSLSKDKDKIKILQRRHVCFPFHLGTCTRRIFKFCCRNQSAGKDSHFTFL